MKKIVLCLITLLISLTLMGCNPEEENNSKCPIVDGQGTLIITFETSGGSALDDMAICLTCAEATEIIELPVPLKDGYKFVGWYADKDLEVEAVPGAGTISNANWSKSGCYDYVTTLYAKWEK